jgi:glycosyltransferase involved in cell wall biosynthesis
VEGTTGYLVPHGDVEALAERMGRLFDQPALRDELGRRARAFAEGFSWDASAEGALEVLRRAVVESPTRGPAALAPSREKEP